MRALRDRASPTHLQDSSGPPRDVMRKLVSSRELSPWGRCTYSVTPVKSASRPPTTASPPCRRTTTSISESHPPPSPRAPKPRPVSGIC